MKELGVMQPLLTLGVFLLLAVLPFIILSVTSFIKLSVVFGILRNAIGAQQVPSSAITSLLAFVLTLHVMAPVGVEIKSAWEEGTVSREKKPEIPAVKDLGTLQVADLLPLGDKLKRVGAPLLRFLEKHSRQKERTFFSGLAEGESFFTLLPAFIISELTEAFAIGFAVFLPFLILDLVVANILVGLGMVMVTPAVVSLPFKIILFVLVDGWFLLCRGLVLGYQ